MRIPLVSKEDVERALDQIDRFGVLRKQRSTRYCLVTRKRHYPPKKVLSIASDIPLSEFGGGSQTNKKLKRLHYRIDQCECRNQGLTISD